MIHTVSGLQEEGAIAIGCCRPQVSDKAEGHPRASGRQWLAAGVQASPLALSRRSVAFQFCYIYWLGCFSLLVARTQVGSPSNHQFISVSLSCLGQVPRPLSLEKQLTEQAQKGRAFSAPGENTQVYPQGEGRPSVSWD